MPSTDSIEISPRRLLRRLSTLAARPCSRRARLALFAVFAAVLTYADAANVKSWSSVNPGMDAAYRTIDAGHPFYYYRGDLQDLQPPARMDPAKLDPYFKAVYNDAGVLLSMSALRVLFDKVGLSKRYSLNNHQLPFFAYLAVLAFGATLVFVRLPAAIAVLAYVPLIRVTVDVSGSLAADTRGVEALALAIFGVYALAIVFGRWRRGMALFIVLTTLFVAWLDLTRQGLITELLLLDAVVMAWFAASALASRLRRRRKQAALYARKTLAIALSIPSAFAFTVVVAAFLSAWYRLPFSLDYVPTHGSGHPLYLSTGYAHNPFNTAWDDDVFQVNYMTFSDRFFVWVYPDWMKTIQPALIAEYRRHVVEDPMVLVRNVVEKARLVNRYMTDAGVAGVFPYDVIYPLEPWQRVMYRATIWGLVFLAAIGSSARFRWLWGALLAMLALLGISLVPSLVVSPGYLLGFLGAMYAVWFAWFGACAAGLLFGRRLRAASGASATRAGKLAASAIVLAGVGAGVHIGVRTLYNARQDGRLLVENPYDVMREKGYRFAEGFNRLSLAQQKRVIRRLLTMSPGATRVETFCRSNREIYEQLGPASPELQTSICAFVLDEPWRQNFRVALVLDYFSDRWHEALPRRDQGPVGSNVTLGSIEPCPERPRVAAKYWWVPAAQVRGRCVYTRFANPNWQGKFYINLLPVPKAFTDGADALIASTQEIVGPPPNSELFYVERDVGVTRLERFTGEYWRRTTAGGSPPRDEIK